MAGEIMGIITGPLCDLRSTLSLPVDFLKGGSDMLGGDTGFTGSLAEAGRKLTKMKNLRH